MAEKPEDQDMDTNRFQMHFLKRRLESFQDWPFEKNCSCTPDKMAEAGFYHCPTENEPDLVKCFICHKELDGWEPEDDPWNEHKSHSGKCPFLVYSNPKNKKRMTVEEFLKLEQQRQILYLKKEVGKLVQQMEEYESSARKQMESLV